MNSDHRIPVVFRHVEDHAVAEDTGVVHDRVELSERVDGTLDDALRSLEIADAVAVGDGLAASLLDLVHDLLRRSRAGAAAVEPPAEVVDDDLRTELRHEKRFLAPDSTTRTGDYDNFAVEKHETTSFW